MIKSQDKTVYPMETSKIISDGKTLYDRDTRGKSWFYLYLDIYLPVVTSDGKMLMTADGKQFCVRQ